MPSSSQDENLEKLQNLKMPDTGMMLIQDVNSSHEISDDSLKLMFVQYDYKFNEILLPACKQKDHNFLDSFLNSSNFKMIFNQDKNNQLNLGSFDQHYIMQSSGIKSEMISVSDMLEIHIQKKSDLSIFYIKACKKILFIHEPENSQEISYSRNQHSRKSIDSSQKLLNQGNIFEIKQQSYRKQNIKYAKTNKFQFKKSAFQEDFDYERNGCVCEIFEDASNEDEMFFELKIETIKGQHKFKYQYLIQAKDISNFVLRHQAQIDSMYKDAILSNYSHEQLTPLNSILNNAVLLIEHFSKIKTKLTSLNCSSQVFQNRQSFNQGAEQNSRSADFEMMDDERKKQYILKKVNESKEMVSHLQFQALILYNYNQSIISLQKLKNKKLEIDLKQASNDPIHQVKQISQPFKYMMKKKNLTMNIKDNLNLNDMEVLCDWKHYKTIFFNLFQNSVKYNEKGGQINIDLSFVNINEMEQQLYLVTQIEDTGKGIEEDRIRFLFKPFSELKQKQCLQDVVDYGLGIGLTCSKEISKALGGDVILVKSQKGCTQFHILLPVQVQIKSNINQNLSVDMKKKVKFLSPSVQSENQFKTLNQQIGKKQSTNLGSQDIQGQLAIQKYKLKYSNKRIYLPAIKENENFEYNSNYQYENISQIGKSNHQKSAFSNYSHSLQNSSRSFSDLQDEDSEMELKFFKEISDFEEKEQIFVVANNIQQNQSLKKQIDILQSSNNETGKNESIQSKNEPWDILNQESIHAKVPFKFETKQQFMGKNNRPIRKSNVNVFQSPMILILNSINNSNSNSAPVFVNEIERQQNLEKRDSQYFAHKELSSGSLQPFKLDKSQFVNLDRQYNSIINQSQNNVDLAMISQYSRGSQDSFKYINSYLSYQNLAIQLCDNEKVCNCKFRILIVDDNDFNLVILQQIFKKIQIDASILRKVKFPLIDQEFVDRDNMKSKKMISFEIDEASDGYQAVESFQKNYLELCSDDNCIRNYKLILMDLGMPLKNGFEASQEILEIQNQMKIKLNKSKKKGSLQFFDSQECEIIALTAFTDQKTKDTCKEIGIKEVQNKPANYDMLMRIILQYNFKLTQEQIQNYFSQLENMTKAF